MDSDRSTERMDQAARAAVALALLGMLVAVPTDRPTVLLGAIVLFLASMNALAIRWAVEWRGGADG